MAVAITQQKSFTIENEDQPQNSYAILKHMQKVGVLCDVTLVAKDVEIPAHKSVLASCSPYFYSMFTNYQTAKQERIPLDVDPQLLPSVINYMYTSKLVVLEQNVVDLLEISKLLLLNDIQAECWGILKQIIGPDNCLHIKNVAAQYGQLDLLDTASSYIDDNFVDAVASKQFLYLTSEELSELISKDTLKMSSEKKVYECIVRWINHDSKGRRKYMRHLMGYVRFKFISKSYLRQHIVKDPFLRGDTYCKDLILEATLEDDETSTLQTKGRRYEKNGKVMLVIGGTEKGCNSLEYYDFEKKCWSNIVKIPFNVNFVKSVVINRKVYVTCRLRKHSLVDTINCYDINTNNWKEITDFTIRRLEYRMAVLNNAIYVISGYAHCDIVNSVEKFDFQSKKWSSVASMLTARQNFGVGVLNGIIYVVGGSTLIKGALVSVECYNHHTNTWKILTDMNHPREELGVCTLDGTLYAIGGYSEGQYLSSVEEYNPESDSWTEGIPMKIARAHHSVAVAGNKIYVTGGYNKANGTLKSIEVYDNITKSWTILPKSMNVARSGHGTVIIEKAN